MKKIKRRIIKWLGIYEHEWVMYHKISKNCWIVGGEYHYCQKCGESIYLPTDWQPISRHTKGCSRR